MPYLSLYRKYRPRSFSEIVGQRHVTQTLANAVRSGHTAHAYLFTGPRGTGKTSTARVLAMALNCEEGTSPEPCGVCESCRRIVSGAALDVIEIDAASNRSVDDMRDLVDKVALVPAEGRIKVYIVDEVHMLTPESFNTFLKTLEEPPPHVIFVLATTEAHKVLPTIMSRCQRFDFRRIGVTDLEELVGRVAAQESITIEPRAVALLAHAADGAVRDALTLLEQAVAYAQGDITAEVVSEILGGIDADLVVEFAGTFLQRDVAAGLALVERVVAEGKDLRQLVVGLIGHYRNLLLVTVDRRGAQALALPEGLAQRVADQARGLSPEEAARTLAVLAETDREFRFTSQPRLLLELAVVRLCRNAAESRPAAAAPPPARPERPAPRPRAAAPPQVADQPAPPPAPETKPAEAAREAPAAPAPPGDEAEQLAEIRRRWEEVVATVNQRNKSLAGYLREATPTALAHGVVTLSFRQQFHHSQVANNESRKKAVAEAIARVTGVTAGIRCDMATEEDRLLRPSPEQPRLIQDVLSTFPGSTVDE